MSRSAVFGIIYHSYKRPKPRVIKLVVVVAVVSHIQRIGCVRMYLPNVDRLLEYSDQ